jgi:CheY-like chemotaxis protein
MKNLTPQGLILPENSWDDVFRLIFNQNPVFTIKDGKHVIRSKILADQSAGSWFKQLVIEDFKKEWVTEILENKSKLLITGRYFNEGLHHRITCNARLDHYAIFMGYPALILRLLPPIRQISSVMIASPNPERPVYLEIPVKGAPSKIQVSEFSMEYLRISKNELDNSILKFEGLEEMNVQFYDLGEVRLNTDRITVEEDTVKLEYKSDNQDVKTVINSYLQEEFRKEIKAPDQCVVMKDEKTPAISKTVLKHILIVDDMPEIHQPLKELLEDEGYKVTMSKDGLTGFQVALAQKPDLILLDIMMPGLSGLQVLDKLREYRATQSIPVIMLTGHAELDMVQKTKQMGISGYIRKPYDLKYVLNRIAEILRSNESQERIP